MQQHGNCHRTDTTWNWGQQFGYCLHRLKIYVSNQAAVTFVVDNAVDPHVNDDSIGFDHLGSNHVRTTDSSNQNVSCLSDGCISKLSVQTGDSRNSSSVSNRATLSTLARQQKVGTAAPAIVAAEVAGGDRRAPVDAVGGDVEAEHEWDEVRRAEPNAPPNRRLRWRRWWSGDCAAILAQGSQKDTANN